MYYRREKVQQAFMQSLRNIQDMASRSAERAREHREKFEATGDRIHRVYWEYAMHNSAQFAAIVRREMGNV